MALGHRPLSANGLLLARSGGPSPATRGAGEQHPHDARLTTTAHYPAPECPCCGGNVLPHAKPYRVHQVFELPKISYFVTEHQLFRGTCTRCVVSAQAELPETISSSQMGTNLLSYIALQSGQFHQSISQIQQQLKQHVGLTFSRGAISEAQGRVSAMLTPRTRPSSSECNRQAISMPMKPGTSVVASGAGCGGR